MIVFDNVSFSYGKRQVLRDVSLSIDARERMAILGEVATGRPPSLN